MSDRHAIVVGGGLAGLTAACELARHDLPVTVLEGGGQLGGRARSTVRDGTIRNLGPHGLALRGPGTAVLEDLGIELPGRSPALHQTRLLLDGRIVSPLDRHLGGVARALPSLARPCGAARSTDPDGSVADWLARMVPDASTRRLLAPLVRLATYADDPEEQAADMLAEAMRVGGVRYLDGGWVALVQRLREAASDAGASIRVGTPAVSVSRDSSWIVTTRDGGRHVATDVILAPGVRRRRPAWSTTSRLQTSCRGGPNGRCQVGWRASTSHSPDDRRARRWSSVSTTRCTCPSSRTGVASRRGVGRSCRPPGSHIADGTICSIEAIRNPDKLAHLGSTNHRRG
jgi:phytoene dehydrogenase-like protein